MSLRIVLVGLLGLAYVLGSHWLMTWAPSSPWVATLLLSPMLGTVALTSWQAGQRVRAAFALAGIAALAVLAASGAQVAAPLLYVSQHVVIHLALAAWFAGTLRAGSEPLISQLAAVVHGRLSAAMQVYTRKVTACWVAYFVAMATVSIALYAMAPFDTWAVFANLVTPLTLAAMFGGERLLRYRLHPEFERSSVRDAIRAYRLSGQAAWARSRGPRP